MKIKQRRQRHERTEYFRRFDRIPYDGGGYAFPCDAEGKLERPEDATRVAKLKADPKYEDYGVDERTHSWVEPTIGICPCGEEVYLDRFTNTCHGCGRDYNMSGQELAPRSQWGEETGESVSDILMADSDPWGGE